MKVQREEVVRADYFGLVVEVVLQMRYYALVRFGGKEFVVDAADLFIKSAAAA